MRVVLFTSRNKDNKHLTEFKQRKQNFLSDKSNEELSLEFAKFVADGREGEMNRLYVSVNKRDQAKTLKALQHLLLDNPNFELPKLQSKVASLAAKVENSAEKKWMFDFDRPKEDLLEFLQDLPVEHEVFETPNNFTVVVSHGFDTRELLEKWSDVELKRDGLLCLDWATTQKGEML